MGPLQRGERDGEVLDGEAGRVERGDLVHGARVPSAAPASTAPSSVTSSRASAPAVDRVRELAVVACLLPVVAEDVRPRQLGDGDLRLARPVGAHEAHVLAGAERAFADHGLVAGRHRHDEVGPERLLERLCDTGAELGRRLLGPPRVDVEDRDRAAAREERPRRRLAR